jgi:hypothetical protein
MPAAQRALHARQELGRSANLPLLTSASAHPGRCPGPRWLQVGEQPLHLLRLSTLREYLRFEFAEFVNPSKKEEGEDEQVGAPCAYCCQLVSWVGLWSGGLGASAGPPPAGHASYAACCMLRGEVCSAACMACMACSSGAAGVGRAMCAPQGS